MIPTKVIYTELHFKTLQYLTYLNINVFGVYIYTTLILNQTGVYCDSLILCISMPVHVKIAICVLYSDYVSGSETEGSEMFEPIKSSLRMLHELSNPSGEYLIFS